jgi:hypothetical protein
MLSSCSETLQSREDIVRIETHAGEYERKDDHLCFRIPSIKHFVSRFLEEQDAIHHFISQESESKKIKPSIP